MSERYGELTRNFVAGLPDDVLRSFASSAMSELNQRRLPLPVEAVGVINEATPKRSPATQTSQRSIREIPVDAEPSILADGRLVVVHQEKHIVKDDIVQYLPALQFETLALLAHNADNLVDRYSLLRLVWGEIVDPHSVMYQWEVGLSKVNPTMSNLRKKLGEDLGNVNYGVIRTIRARGWIALSSLNSARASLR